ncbi:unnamed protein product, partial [Ilex paraguariensis]
VYPTYHSFIVIPDRANATLAKDRARLQAQRTATSYSRQRTVIPSRRNRPVKNFLSFLYASEPCETTSSALSIPNEAFLLPTPSIDLTFLPDHTSIPVDLPVNLEASVSSANLPTDFETVIPTANLPADLETLVPSLEPLTGKVPAASLVIPSSPRQDDTKPEEKLTKKRRIKSPPILEWSKYAFRPCSKGERQRNNHLGLGRRRHECSGGDCQGCNSATQSFCECGGLR